MDLPRYKVCIPLTRPAINRWGIPHKSYIFLLSGSVLFSAWFCQGQWYGYLIAVPFFLALRALTDHDHNFFRIFQLWVKTKAKSIIFNIVNGRRVLGASMLAPMPDGLPMRRSDVNGAI